VRKGEKAKKKGKPVTFRGNLLTDEEKKNVTVSNHVEIVTGWDNMLDRLEKHWEVAEELEDDNFLMKKSLPSTRKMRTR
jgi:hypothetical protein